MPLNNFFLSILSSWELSYAELKEEGCDILICLFVKMCLFWKQLSREKKPLPEKTSLLQQIPCRSFSVLFLSTFPVRMSAAMSLPFSDDP